MNFLFIIKLIYCSKHKKSNRIGFPVRDDVSKNKLNRIKRFENLESKFYSNYEKDLVHPIVIFNPVSKCKEHTNFQYYHYDLGSLKYSTILNLSHYFYEELIKHPKFITKCKKIGLNSHSLPSKTMFEQFVLKFVTDIDFEYRNSKGNRFIQSIAWIAHKHIVSWSKTHLTSYMHNKWSIVWQNIINSIHISTDRHCYWRVEFLFDGDQIAFANKQLEQLEKGEMSRPKLYPTNIDHSYSKYAIEKFADPPLDRIIN